MLRSRAGPMDFQRSGDHSPWQVPIDSVPVKKPADGFAQKKADILAKSETDPLADVFGNALSFAASPPTSPVVSPRKVIQPRRRPAGAFRRNPFRQGSAGSDSEEEDEDVPVKGVSENAPGRKPN
ncbi:hypothetical protein HKX48_004425 [Thoreauomyces humboldtii]|nr:hypothetical protein HKX48_004425 [Thoreauomyces humboldtii]